MAEPKYRFYATYNSVQTEVFPVFKDKPELNYESNANLRDFIQVIDAEFLFKGDDYDYFLNIEQTDQCALITFDIFVYCDGAYQSFWSGEFGTIDGKFDLDKCEFRIIANTSNNTYQCLLSGLEINICEITDVYTVQQNTDLYEYCVKFEDLILYVASQTCSNISSVISDFFQINPENVSTVNYVTNETNPYTKMYMTPLSNVRRMVSPSTLTEPATLEKISFKDLMNDLNVLFNVEWVVSGSVLRIEHYSYDWGVSGLDLTTPTYEKYVSGTRRYSYDRENSPRYEKWTMFSSDQGCIITYDNACGKNDLDDNTINYDVKKIFTDYYRARSEQDKLAEDTKGIFLFATEDTGDNEMLGIDQNEELVLSRLVLKFHRHGRPNQNGVFEFNLVTGDYTDQDYGDFFIYSEKPLKVQDDFSVPLCCSTAFNPVDTITTYFGDGYVNSAKLNLYSRMLTLSLKYKTNPDNTDIEPDDISDLSVWYKFNTGITVSGGGFVDQWDDQSGNARHLKPLNVLNKALEIDGYLFFDNSVMLTDDSFVTFDNENGTLFIVYYNDPISGLSTDSIIATTSNFWGGSPHWDVGLKIASGAKLYSFVESFYYPATGYWGSGDYKWGDYQNQIFTMVRDNADNTSAIFLNGKPTKNHKITTFTSGGAAARFALGGSNGSYEFVGGIYEVILYDKVLTDMERQKVELYLAKKFNLSMYTIS